MSILEIVDGDSEISTTKSGLSRKASVWSSDAYGWKKIPYICVVPRM